MLAFVYKSSRKEQLYIYLLERDGFHKLPQELLHGLGEMIFVMQVALDQRQQLGREDITIVRTNLQQQGFHIQFPPIVDLRNDAQ